MKDQETFNRDIVLFALYELGGAKRPVHTEDIAHRIFQYPIGRQRYRWEHYDMYPDKERVARELRRLKGRQGTAFVKGHVNIGAKKDRIDGWMITAAGVDRVGLWRAGVWEGGLYGVGEDLGVIESAGG